MKKLLFFLAVFLSGCAGSVSMIEGPDTTNVAILAEDVKHAKVFIPSDDKKSWIPAYKDLPARKTWTYIKETEPGN